MLVIMSWQRVIFGIVVPRSKQQYAVSLNVHFYPPQNQKNQHPKACPMINVNQTKVIRPKMLFSGSSDHYLNDPLYPKRDGLDENEFKDGINWREGEPVDYSIVNVTYLKERKGNVASHFFRSWNLSVKRQSYSHMFMR